MERVCLLCQLATLAARRPQSAAIVSTFGNRQVHSRRGDRDNAASDDGLEGVLPDREASASAPRDPELSEIDIVRASRLSTKLARREVVRRPGSTVGDSVLRFQVKFDNGAPASSPSPKRRFQLRHYIYEESPTAKDLLVGSRQPSVLPPPRRKPFVFRKLFDEESPAGKDLHIGPRQTPMRYNHPHARPLVRPNTFFVGPRSVHDRGVVKGARHKTAPLVKKYMLAFRKEKPLSGEPLRQPVSDGSQLMRQRVLAPPLIRHHTIHRHKRRGLNQRPRKHLIRKERWVVKKEPWVVKKYRIGVQLNRLASRSEAPIKRRHLHRRNSYPGSKWRMESIRESKQRISELVRHLIRLAPTSTQDSDAGTGREQTSSTAPAAATTPQPVLQECKGLPSPMGRLMAMLAPSARWRSMKRKPGVRQFTTFARAANAQREAQVAGRGENSAEVELQRAVAHNSEFRLRRVDPWQRQKGDGPSLFQRERPAPSAQPGLDVKYSSSEPTASRGHWTSGGRSRRDMTQLPNQSDIQYKSLFSRQESKMSNDKWTPATSSHQRFPTALGGREMRRSNEYAQSSQNWTPASGPRGVDRGFNVTYTRGEGGVDRLVPMPKTAAPRPAQSYQRNDVESGTDFSAPRKPIAQPRIHNPRLRVDKLLQDMQDMRPDSRHDSRKNAKRGKRRDEDEDEDGAYGERYRESDKDGGLKKAQAKKAQRKQETAKPQNQLKLPAHISVANLANVFGVRYEAFALTMKNLGFEDARHNYVLSSEDAGLIAMEFGYQPVFDKSTVELIASPWPEDKTSLPARPPVVTIMGHVDHGKTTILDYLRKSSVAAHEHGGITQHIGAFSVSMASGKKITFLDTPGHAAFLSMRQRGANVTDIVILVVAADDGIMPQTIEAIKHAQAAQVPIIVAINKVDKPEKNITRIMQELARHNVEPEEFGGDTQVVHVSGKTGHGMPDLEEAIVTLSEILDHRAPLDGAVEGWVLESAVKPSRGKVATVLVRRGTLRPGDVVVAGTAWARARTLRDAAGLAVREAGPGTPVELDGWRQRPAPGDEVLQSPAGERAAAAVVESRAAMADMARLAKDVAAANAVRQQGAAADGDEAAGASKEERHRDRAIDGVFVEKSPQGVAAGKGSSTGGALDVHFVVKADVVGSVEAATNLIAGLGDGRTVRASVVRAQAGPVSESDIELASCAGTGGASGVVLAFNAGVERGARDLAARRGVQVLEHSIIYRIAEDVVKLMESRLPDIVSWKVLGDGLVFATDKYTVKGRKTKRIAGVKVKSGTLVSGGMVRVMRKAEVIYDGTILSLRHHKDIVSEAKKDSECGVTFRDWDQFEIGDQLQVVEEVRERPKLAVGQ